MTTTSPTVDDLLNDARQAWGEFTTAAIAGEPAVEAFTAYRAALAVADAIDKQAKAGPYKESLARYEKIAARVNAANLAIASAGIGSGMVSAVASGPARTAEQRAQTIRDTNQELNRLAVECGASGYVPRDLDDHSLAHVLGFAEEPSRPSPRRPSSAFETDYRRALDTMLAGHFAAAERDAIAAWQQRQ